VASLISVGRPAIEAKGAQFASMAAHYANAMRKFGRLPRKLAFPAKQAVFCAARLARMFKPQAQTS
jgi:hypothetical protein